MALRDHITPRITVPLVDGNTVAVRGLNLDDFTLLIGEHFEDVARIAELYAEHKNSIFSSKPFQEMILKTVSKFPRLVSEVISIAADEPDAKDVKLALGLQLAAIHAIIKQTMEEAGGLGNLIAQLRALAPGLVPVLERKLGGSNNTKPSRTSTGPGASK